MAENILEHLRTRQPRKVIVLVGLLHKYPLEDLLSHAQQTQGFELQALSSGRPAEL